MKTTQITLFIVDDHQMFLEGIESILSEIKNFKTVGIAKNGEEALKLLPHFKPNVVLTDIEMPKINGIHLVEKIKKQFPETKTIAVSSHTNSKTISDAIKAGINGYIFKNTGKHELIKAIESVNNGDNYFTHEVKTIINNSLFNPQKKRKEAVKLSKREKEVLILISEEKSTQEISEQLLISFNTVESHRKNLMRKVGTKNMIGLVKYAINQGII